jgi:hypothetical protein
VKRGLLALFAAGAVALLAAHVAWWYLPRERAETPRLRPARDRAGSSAGEPAGEPLQLLAAGAYDVCLWVPYPHQNLGVLAGAVGDLQDVVGAAARLNAGEASPRRANEPQEAPSFGPFEVPPASELVACSDLAGGRLRVVARIYPALSVVAKLAGRLAGNPWLSGGVAGRMRIAWEGRLWSVTAGDEPPPAPDGLAAPAGALGPAGPPVAPPVLPESLAVVHWTGVRREIPAGYYALTRRGQDLEVSLVGGAAGATGPASAAEAPVQTAAGGAAGPLPALLIAVGAEGPGSALGGTASGALGNAGSGALGGAASGGLGNADSGGLSSAGRGALGNAGGGARGSAGSSGAPAGPRSGAAAGLPPAAMALFEAGGSRVSSLGSLPGLAVFNAATAAGADRWRLPTEGIFRLLAGRLPASELAGWRIVALDKDSLRQAAALAPGLAALFSPDVPSPPAGAAGARLSLGVWLEPRSALHIVSRIRRFVESFPLASHRQVELWRDWEAVLYPLANCEHASLTATAEPPAMRVLLQACTASGPR